MNPAPTRQAKGKAPQSQSLLLSKWLKTGVRKWFQDTFAFLLSVPPSLTNSSLPVTVFLSNFKDRIKTLSDRVKVSHEQTSLKVQV